MAVAVSGSGASGGGTGTPTTCSITLPAATDAAFVRVSSTFLYPNDGSGTATVSLVGVPSPTFRERGAG